jgi:hypothetical protein
VAVDVESARRDWQDAYRRLGELGQDPRAAEGAHVQLRAVTEELRKRVGSSFTLGELAHEYLRSDTWARNAIVEGPSYPGRLSSLAVVEGAAFHLYSRGAADYVP